jgi:hypothetical protein
MKKQFLTSALMVGTVAIGSLAAIGGAEAAAIVKNGGGTITGITALQVGSTTYNVDFSNANFTSLFGPQTPPSTLPTFWQNEPGASAAANAINALLNGDGEFGSVFLGNAASYLIPYNLIGRGNNATVEAVLGLQDSTPAWISVLTTAPRNGVGNQPVYAVFSEVPSTAVPTPALLPGLIGLGVTALRKKKQTAKQEA